MKFEVIDTRYMKGRAYKLPVDHPIGRIRFDDTGDEIRAIREWAKQEGVTLKSHYYRQRTLEYGHVTRLEIVVFDYKPEAYTPSVPMRSYA